jgi:hypothetical protein
MLVYMAVSIWDYHRRIFTWQDSDLSSRGICAWWVVEHWQKELHIFNFVDNINVFVPMVTLTWQVKHSREFYQKRMASYIGMCALLWWYNGNGRSSLLFSSCPFVSRVHSIISGIASQGTVPVHRDRKRACVNHNSATWAATVWGIRKERNARIFHGTSRRISLVAQEVVELAWTWRAAYNI